MRVGFVIAEDPAAQDPDQDRYREALAALGVTVEARPWTAPVDWSACDLVLVRSPWDYCARVEEFRAWLDRLEAQALPAVHNPPGLIRWNLDKRYLEDLRQGGVRTVPTTFATTAEAVRDALAAHADHPEVVVKPAVSAGSRHTGRFVPGDPRATALAATILGEGGTVMVQPAVASVATEGEVGIVAFDGEVSHAVRRAPILGPGGIQVTDAAHQEVERTEPTPAQRELAAAGAARAGAVATARGWLPPGQPLLYGRYDLVRLDDGTEALLEAELFEPSFFLEVDPEAPARFARAVHRRLTGPGPGLSPAR